MQGRCKPVYILAIVAPIAALEITSPHSDTTSLDLTKELQIQWETNSTDPKFFQVGLVRLPAPDGYRSGSDHHMVWETSAGNGSILVDDAVKGESCRLDFEANEFDRHLLAPSIEFTVEKSSTSNTTGTSIISSSIPTPTPSGTDSSNGATCLKAFSAAGAFVMAIFALL